jgi:hypothetical protein
MAATMERLHEYQTFNGQFCKRMFDFLSIMFPAQVGYSYVWDNICFISRSSQSKLLLRDTSGVVNDPSGPRIMSHRDLEAYLGRYSGLMLYLREMDESAYGKICGVIIYFLSSIITISFHCSQAYFSAASDLHSTQIKALLSIHLDFVKKATEEELEQGKSQQSTMTFKQKNQQHYFTCRINDNSKTCHTAPRRYRY